MSDTLRSAPQAPGDLTEHPVASELLFEGSFLRALRDTVRLPDGRTAHREYVKHPGAVVVVALLDDGRVVLERQYRYPVGRLMIEFPAGKLDAGEDPLRCAQREMHEETGYRARQWARAGAMHLAIAYSDEVIHVYFARGLVAGPARLDDGEFLEVFSATPAQLREWVRSGAVTDAKTLSCMVWLDALERGDWQPSWISGDIDDLR